MSDYSRVPNDDTINKTAEALRANGFTVIIAKDGQAAKKAVLGIVPQGAEVFTATSKTSDDIGLSAALNSSDYNAVRDGFVALMGDPAKKRQMKRLASSPEYVVGSVHAITQEGSIFIASASGSQLPSESYGADHVIWVVGAQKIVANQEDAFKRIHQYVLPLEDARARQVYGFPSAVRKLLIMNAEAPGRATVVLIKEALGF